MNVRQEVVDALFPNNAPEGSNLRTQVLYSLGLITKPGDGDLRAQVAAELFSAGGSPPA